MIDIKFNVSLNNFNHFYFTRLDSYIKFFVHILADISRSPVYPWNVRCP